MAYGDGRNSQTKYYSRTKQELLELLKNDGEVNDMIMKLIKKMTQRSSSNTDVKKYTDEINRLQSENRQLSQEVSQQKSFLMNKESENDNLKNDIRNFQNQLHSQTQKTSQAKNEINTLENEKQDLLNIAEKYNSIASKFENLIKIHKMYLSINNVHGVFLNSLFKGKSIDVFFTCGVQEKKIASLWDYIKSSIIEEKRNIEELKQIFAYFFGLYNSIYHPPLYRSNNVRINERFNDEKHIKVSQHNHSGKIRKIVFDGYYNSNTDEIIKKTIVEII